jgi:acetate kinase
MRILVLNSGSSSIKFSIFETSHAEAVPTLSSDGELSNIGTPHAKLTVDGSAKAVAAATLDSAITLVLGAIASQPAPDAVGYRVVHPGPQIRDHQPVTPQLLEALAQARDFAPLHDPEALQLIRATMQRLPHAAHFACFDTVFHQTMPEEATVYPLPASLREQGIRRYGFHGLSCESIVRQLALRGPVSQRVVIAHLGSGCSVTALQDGRSVDTSMGLTPTGGVVMGTRSGDLDPGLVLYLLRQQQGSREDAAIAVETMLNHESGISVLAGMPNDVKAIRAAAARGNPAAQLALKVFTRSITKAIGAYCWLLGGLDTIVFSGGIGEHDAHTRDEILANLVTLGVETLAAPPHASADGIQTISSSASRIQVQVVPAQEDLMIALHVLRMAQSTKPVHSAWQHKGLPCPTPHLLRSLLKNSASPTPTGAPATTSARACSTFATTRCCASRSSPSTLRTVCSATGAPTPARALPGSTSIA